MAHIRISSATATYLRRASAPVPSENKISKTTRSFSLNDLAISEERRQDVREAFGMFESRKGKMSARDLGPFLRCLGLNPSERDLEEARHELDVSTSGRIAYTDVEKYLIKSANMFAEETEDILEAFKVLDKLGTGKIPVSDFRRCMTTMGDKMSQEEVEEILNYAKTDGVGFIEYEDLLRELNISTQNDRK